MTNQIKHTLITSILISGLTLISGTSFAAPSTLINPDTQVSISINDDYDNDDYEIDNNDGAYEIDGANNYYDENGNLITDTGHVIGETVQDVGTATGNAIQNVGNAIGNVL